MLKTLFDDECVDGYLWMFLINGFYDDDCCLLMDFYECCLLMMNVDGFLWMLMNIMSCYWILLCDYNDWRVHELMMNVYMY